ncbi:MAG: aminopeptidase P family protein [Chloroflexi bacterium]|nr:aminopeptidase P family protein [Chloroflexota bacterium]
MSESHGFTAVPFPAVPGAELTDRIHRLQAVMQATGLDLFIAIHRTGLFYLGGTTHQSHLLVPVKEDPIFLVRKAVGRARQESALHVEAIRSLRDLPRWAAEILDRSPQTVGMELDVLPANLYQTYQSLFAPAQIQDASDLLRRLRMVKSPWEIERIRKAAHLAAGMAHAAKDFLAQAGTGTLVPITELDLLAAIEAAGRRLGHQGEIYTHHWNQNLIYSQVLSGPRGAVPSGVFDGSLGGMGLSGAMPIGPSRQIIEPHTPVIIDIVAASEGYAIDQTRTYAMGKLSPDWHARYAATQHIQEMIVREIRPGVPAASLYEAGLEEAARLGVADYFLGYKEDQVRFVGHSVGIEIDELPVLARSDATALEPGMVLAIEPKLIYPGEGAIGLENTWLVTPVGAEKLTLLPDDLVEL